MGFKVFVINWKIKLNYGWLLRKSLCYMVCVKFFIYVLISLFLVYIIVFWSLDSLFFWEVVLRVIFNVRNIKELGDI